MAELVPPEDLKTEIYPDRGRGGQHVGTNSGIKLTHIPSGIIVIVETDRSQHRNRSIALDAIQGALTSPHFRGNP